ncbi:uncharacterized protein [Periplaneta americana]|uniref:uncharacterized protein isoform X4 n=1 Tax=Periplaneta americana TaxID=6978 RepID=UPI0037E726C9
MVPNAMNYLTKAVECDFKLRVDDKRTFNDITYCSLVGGTAVWAALGRLLGRRLPLAAAVLCEAGSAVVMSFARNRSLFMTCRFLWSMCAAGTHCLAVIFLAEVQPPRHRGAALSFLQVASTVGAILVPPLSHALAGAFIFSSYFLHVSNHGLIFTCLFEAACVMAITPALCLATELFSTRYRPMGVALIVGAGQLGAILGNMGFLLAINNTCVYLVSAMAIAITVAGFLVLLSVPDTIDHSRVNLWLEKLDKMNSCPEEMTIRNDYIWFLLLMMQNQRLTVPFNKLPPAGNLRHLAQVLPSKVYEDVLMASNQNMACLDKLPEEEENPSKEHELSGTPIPPSKFLDIQPKPKNGMMCYMGVFSSRHNE